MSKVNFLKKVIFPLLVCSSSPKYCTWDECLHCFWLYKKVQNYLQKLFSRFFAFYNSRWDSRPNFRFYQNNPRFTKVKNRKVMGSSSVCFINLFFVPINTIKISKNIFRWYWLLPRRFWWSRNLHWWSKPTGLIWCGIMGLRLRRPWLPRGLRQSRLCHGLDRGNHWR